MQFFLNFRREKGIEVKSYHRDPLKGTSLRENASFDVQIVKIGSLRRPAVEAKKRKQEKKESHKQ